jgi:hypothetical protein
MLIAKTDSAIVIWWFKQDSASTNITAVLAAKPANNTNCEVYSKVANITNCKTLSERLLN